MKKAPIIGTVLVVLAATALVLALFTGRSNESDQPTGGTQFPSGGSSLPGSELPQGTILIGAQEEGEVQVNDFVHDGTTVADVVNQGSYVLVGDLGYCLADGTCPRATDIERFAISYSEEGSVFTIVLLAEPLGEVRMEAEQHLMNRLGIPEVLMCQLNYYVGTPSFVNESYSNGNIGFSFCPQATLLP